MNKDKLKSYDIGANVFTTVCQYADAMEGVLGYATWYKERSKIFLTDTFSILAEGFDIEELIIQTLNHECIHELIYHLEGFDTSEIIDHIKNPSPNVNYLQRHQNKFPKHKLCKKEMDW